MYDKSVSLTAFFGSYLSGVKKVNARPYFVTSVGSKSILFGSKFVSFGSRFVSFGSKFTSLSHKVTCGAYPPG